MIMRDHHNLCDVADKDKTITLSPKRKNPKGKVST